MADQLCKECGCQCRSCDQSALHLHVEIENLKQRLVERDRHIVTMETNFLSEADKFPDGEYAALTEEILTWQEKYSRLYESYKRVQKVNQGLEDKLLRVVDKCESEKGALTRDVASLTQRLVDARFNVTRLQEENERYRNDLSLAIQLLQCKPANFVPQKFDQLPSELQQKVRSYVTSKKRPSEGNGLPPKVERRTIKVPIPTFPPTAMVYSVNKSPSEKDLSDEEKEIGDGKPPVDIVSAAILAKILEERERERLHTRHCASCTCPRLAMQVDVSTQTTANFTASSAICNRCSETPSPVRMSLRYSSSLLGSGEASQVLVSLTDDTASDTVPSSKPSSTGNSPSGSATASLLLSKEERKKIDDKGNIRQSSELQTTSSKIPEHPGWDDWSHSTTNTKKGPSHTSEILQAMSQNEVSMPKVSTNSSPSFFRVNTSVMPSSASGLSASNWPKAENCQADRKYSKSRGNFDNHESIIDILALDSRENGCKDGESVFVNLEGSQVGKETLNQDSQANSVHNNYILKMNQTRLLPETKLYASGDTIEIPPTDPLKYSADCERRLSNSSLKESSQALNSLSNRSPRTTEGKEREVRRVGPRPCSLRFQEGSNNILLDNAHSYAPVLYTSRQNSSHTSARVSDALVHGARSRSASASSSDELWNHATDATVSTTSSSNQRILQRVTGSRTETGV